MPSFLQKLQAMATGKQPATVEPAGQLPNQQQQQQQQQPNIQQPQYENPLDLYSALSQNNASSTKTAPEFTIPQETIGKVSGQLDFTKSIPQDVMTRLQSGDQTALLEAFNFLGRAVYGTTMEHGVAVTGKHLNDRFAFEQEGFDARVNSHLTTSNVKSISSLHPQAQAMFKDTMRKLQAQYPGASQEDIEGAAWEIQESLASQFNRSQQQAQQEQKPQEYDYDSMAGYQGGEASQ